MEVLELIRDETWYLSNLHSDIARYLGRVKWESKYEEAAMVGAACKAETASEVEPTPQTKKTESD